MKDRLIELAERCESADGPDRVLDYDIARALNLIAIPPDDPIIKITREGYETVHYASGGVSQGREAKPYTASLDAAMTLVPEGCGMDLRSFVSGGGRADLYPKGFTKAPVTSLNCATPALALCAAALRSKAKDHSGGGE